MSRLLWMLRYVRIALRSRYEIGAREAWQWADAAWDDSESGAMTPDEAFHENAYDWTIG